MGKLHGTVWDGLALERRRAAPDPDAATRAVALPPGWGDLAAAALAALAPGSGPTSLPRAAESWIARIGAPASLAEGLRALLLARRGAPGAELWRGARRVEPRFVLNLPAFLEADGEFDCGGFAEACALGVQALDAASGGRATRLRLGFADLAGLLAGLGLPYDSNDARAVAGAVAALARGAAEAESGRMAARLGAREPVALLWPAPPGATPVPGLAAAARAALEAAAASPGLRHQALLILAPADAVEALLGAETAGIAPAAGATRSVLSPDGHGIEVPTAAALLAARVAPGRVATVLAPPDAAARRAMHGAVAPFLHAAPPAPLALAGPAIPPPRAVEPRRGSAILVSIGGQRIGLRMTEDAAGGLIGIGFDLPRETPARRAALEDLARAVSLGLAHGVPLAAFVDAYAYSPGPLGGAVEGDRGIAQAASVLDWAFRRLARERLDRLLPDPPVPASLPSAPGLPLDLPATPARRFRLAG